MPVNLSTIGILYSNIAKVYSNKDGSIHSLKFHKKALNIFQNYYGETDLHVVACLNNIGDVYRKQRNYSHASNCYQQAQQIYCSSLSLTHANIIKITKAIQCVSLKTFLLCLIVDLNKSLKENRVNS